ncbi:MAG TPA: alpha/beta hydrolase, partial [Acidimicrobiales bacterium]|nr:alpha/beta hydrolase [Acidimicrobiales bacterium]
MGEALIDGIVTRYEVAGSGPPLLMLSPGGFNATLDNWNVLGVYRRLSLVGHLSASFTCITFDRREAGGSGGRVQMVGWDDYAIQAKGLLDHLGIQRAHLVGGCAGCSVALALASTHPEAVAGIALFWPAGGARYRMKQQARFARHLSFVDDHGVAGVAALAGEGDTSFADDARVGPWGSCIRRDRSFAERFQGMDTDRYRTLVAGMARKMFDRDTVPGAEPEALLTTDAPSLVIPGHDESHATSAARYL